MNNSNNLKTPNISKVSFGGLRFEDQKEGLSKNHHVVNFYQFHSGSGVHYTIDTKLRIQIQYEQNSRILRGIEPSFDSPSYIYKQKYIKPTMIDVDYFTTRLFHLLLQRSSKHTLLQNNRLRPFTRKTPGNCKYLS